MSTNYEKYKLLQNNRKLRDGVDQMTNDQIQNKAQIFFSGSNRSSNRTFGGHESEFGSNQKPVQFQRKLNFSNEQENQNGFQAQVTVNFNEKDNRQPQKSINQNAMYICEPTISSSNIDSKNYNTQAFPSVIASKVNSNLTSQIHSPTQDKLKKDVINFDRVYQYQLSNQQTNLNLENHQEQFDNFKANQNIQQNMSEVNPQQLHQSYNETLQNTVTLLISKFDQFQDKYEKLFQEQDKKFLLFESQIGSIQRVGQVQKDQIQSQIHDLNFKFDQRLTSYNSIIDQQKQIQYQINSRFQEFVKFKADTEYKLDRKLFEHKLRQNTSQSFHRDNQIEESQSIQKMKIIENQNSVIKATSPLRTKAQTFFPQNNIQIQNHSNKLNQDENIYNFTSNFVKESQMSLESRIKSELINIFEQKISNLSCELADDVSKIENKVYELKTDIKGAKEQVRDGMFSLEQQFHQLEVNQSSGRHNKSANRSQDLNNPLFQNQIQKIVQDEVKKSILSPTTVKDNQKKIKRLLKNFQIVQKEHQEMQNQIQNYTVIVDKIKSNSFKFHCEKSSVKFREIEYHTRRDFYIFHKKLRATFELVFKLLKDAFKRDSKIVQNLLETHKHPSGFGLNVRNQTNDDLKDYRKQVLKQGFQLPKLIPIWDDDELTERREDKAYIDLRFDKDQPINSKSANTNSIIDVKIPIKKKKTKSPESPNDKEKILEQKVTKHRKTNSLITKISKPKQRNIEIQSQQLNIRSSPKYSTQDYVKTTDYSQNAVRSPMHDMNQEMFKQQYLDTQILSLQNKNDLNLSRTNTQLENPQLQSLNQENEQDEYKNNNKSEDEIEDMGEEEPVNQTEEEEDYDEEEDDYDDQKEYSLNEYDNDDSQQDGPDLIQNDQNLNESQFESENSN